MFDAGKLKFYSLQNIAAAGLMPTEALVELGEAFYYERTIGINRAYSASYTTDLIALTNPKFS